MNTEMFRISFARGKNASARVWLWLEQERYRETITVILSLGTIGLGLVMILDPAAFYKDSFAVAVAWMPPPTWGCLFAFIAAALLATIAGGRRDAYWPAMGLTFTYSAWSAAALKSAAEPEAVLSAVVIYSTLSLAFAVTALSYWHETRRPVP
ncbi:MAG: hypothetical protein WBH03_21380 [Cyclobacteriaceae bacterium]